MTITMICEKTGLPFEAENRRRKSHPVVQGWMQRAYDEGWYQQASDAIYGNSARFVEKQQFTSIEQFVAYFTQLQQSSIQSNKEREQSDAQSKRDAADAKRQRYITNDLLRGRGYGWKRFENDEEDIDMFGAPEVEYTLYSPDHRPVSVKEAMQELAYQDVEFAHKWLADRNIAEEVPAIEVKRQEETANVAKAQNIEYTPEQIAYQQEAIPAFIEAGCTPEIAVREAKRLSVPHSPQEDEVRLSPVRLRNTDAALVINSDLRYGVLLDGHWFGIEEIMDEYPETSYLAQYAERNKRNASK